MILIYIYFTFNARKSFQINKWKIRNITTIQQTEQKQFVENRRNKLPKANREIKGKESENLEKHKRTWKVGGRRKKKYFSYQNLCN